MASVVLSALRRTPDAKYGAQTSAEIDVDGTTTELYIKHPAFVPELRTNRGDVFFAAGLFVAMRTGNELRLAEPVSASLLENADTLQDVFTTWYPHLFTKVQITAPPSQRNKVARRARGVRAMSFTGGVDSIFSLLTTPLPRWLVNSAGLELAARQDISDATDARIDRIAAKVGSERLGLNSNLRKFMLNNDITWGEHSFAGMLASFGHLLSPLIDTYVIPAGKSYLTTMPWGSTPLCDPLFGSDRLKVIHHGATHNRARKTEFIAHHELTRTELRICLKINSDDNCGECRKCLRTMFTLEIFDALRTSERLPQTVDITKMLNLGAHHVQDIQMLIDARELAIARNTRQELIDDITRVIDHWSEELGVDAAASAGPVREPHGT